MTESIFQKNVFVAYFEFLVWPIQSLISHLNFIHTENPQHMMMRSSAFMRKWSSKLKRKKTGLCCRYTPITYIKLVVDFFAKSIKYRTSSSASLPLHFVLRPFSFIPALKDYERFLSRSQDLELQLSSKEKELEQLFQKQRRVSEK